MVDKSNKTDSPSNKNHIVIWGIILSFIIPPVGLFHCIINFNKIDKEDKIRKYLMIGGIIVSICGTIYWGILAYVFITGMNMILGPAQTKQFEELKGFREANTNILDYKYKTERNSSREGLNDDYLSNRSCELDRKEEVTKCTTVSNRLGTTIFIHSKNTHWVLLKDGWRITRGGRADILQEIADGIDMKAIEKLPNEIIDNENYMVYKILKSDPNESFNILGVKTVVEFIVKIRETDNLIIFAEEKRDSGNQHDYEKYEFSGFNQEVSIAVPS